MKIDTFYQLFYDITALDALNIICQFFNAGNAVIYIDGRRFTVLDLFDSLNMYMDGLAREIVIRFFGGPHKHGRWFTGTLLTMLADHAAYQTSTGHKEKVQQAIFWLGSNVTK